ncbi:MOSC domain-containing protein [Flavivirga rizhaonensis]|uniref:MOSC domain-containing protein n=1 Tax=Flavivirga rizhaonensis TaxID=2559571 RepID=A0A4S1E1I2_9FLAO|nr:MOSC domain-containing protein [Flavivirga rizhaonensis]TGV04369.1 MOSC domain-containing protein [Flavivirga rizhaonensis]
MEKGIVLSLSKSDTHTFKKVNQRSINLIKGLGVEGDAHMGKTVKHRSRVAKDPSQPNLRQVHLIHSELHDELESLGFKIKAGEMGENITTKGIDLLSLPKDTILNIGKTARIKITGLRNPCNQLNLFKKGLMNAVLDKDENGALIRKAGIMGIVLENGIIEIGDTIQVIMPDMPHTKLDRV